MTTHLLNFNNILFRFFKNFGKNLKFWRDVELRPIPLKYIAAPCKGVNFWGVGGHVSPNNMRGYITCILSPGTPNRGGLNPPPLNFGEGVEPSPPDFEKKNF